ncbi:MAG: RHS repeat protein, partial [Verrucomicrobia bacterium]|nr:RHS repeat protein [Verrucomicrobiota bacterium]
MKVTIGLGPQTPNESAGFLSLNEVRASAKLASPAILHASVSTNGVEVIKDGSGILRQVKTSQVLADVVAANPFSYTISFYHAAGIGEKVGSYYPPGATPFQAVTIRNPDASTNTFNRLQVIESGGNSRTHEFVWTEAFKQWELITGNARRESKSTAWNYGTTTNRVETTSVKNAEGTTEVYRVVNTYQTFPWREELVQRVVGAAGSAQTTTWTYETNPAFPNSYGRVIQRVDPSGAWERYEYDSVGRTVKVIAAVGDAPVSAGESASRVAATTYAGDNMTITKVETLLGQEVARRYTVLHPGEMQAIVATTPGASQTDPSNLVTVTKKYTSGAFSNEVQSVKSPDGTMSLYTYLMSGNQKTTTVKTGQPNAGETDIVDGTRIVTVVDQAGNALTETTTDIASGLLLTSATTTQQDEFGRPTRVDYNDGTHIARNYGCCGVESETDREGITTTFIHDDLKRVIASTRVGITTLTTYDAEGRVLTTTRKGGDASEITTNTSTFDVAGRRTSSKNALNNTTTFSETIDGNGHTVKTTNLANGATRIETFAKDGSLLSVTGSGTHPLRYEYGVDANGRFTKEIRVGDNGAETEWSKTYTDMAGRPYKTVQADLPPFSGGGATSQSFFNNKGQLIRQVDPDGVATLFFYNAKGEQEYTVLDVNQDGVINLSGADRITRTVNNVTTAHGTTVRRSTTDVWTTDNTGASITAALNETSADGLQSWNTAFGLTTHTQTAFDGAGGRTVVVTAPDGTTTTSTYQNGRLLSSVSSVSS